MAPRELPRGRLLDILDRRFDRRVTFVRAGAGFGKTTLLRQMLASSVATARGVDFVLSCSVDDDALSVFARRLQALVGIPDEPADDPQTVARAVSRAMAAQSPVDVAVVIDDAHRLGRATASAAVLRDLLESLPSNGHLVVLGRRTTDFSIAKDIVQETGVLVEESELAFTVGEWRSWTGSEADYIPWPAVASLRLRSRQHDASASTVSPLTDEYLWAEVLRTVSAETRRAIAIGSLLGEGPWELLARAVDAPIDRIELASVPLTQTDSKGWWIHDLWSEHATADLQPDERTRALRVAAAYHLENDRPVEAFRFALAADDEALLRRIAIAGVAGTLTVGSDVLTSWVSSVRRTRPGSFLLLFLEFRHAVDARDRQRVLALAPDVLDRASTEGTLDEKCVAAIDVAFAAVTLGDIDLFVRVGRLVRELAHGGDPRAVGLARIGDALVAETRGDIDGAVHRVLDMPQSAGTRVVALSRYLAVRMLTIAGRYEEAIQHIATLPSETPHDRALKLNFELLSALGTGRLEEAERFAATATSIHDEVGIDNHTSSLLKKRRVLATLLGRPLSSPDPTGSQRLVRSDIERAIEETVEAVEAGDDERARRHFELLATHGASGDRALAIIARLAGWVLGATDDLPWHGSQQSVLRSIGSPLRALRQGVLEPLDARVTVEAARALLVPRWRIELACVAFARGSKLLAREIVRQTEPTSAAHLTRLAQHENQAIARAAASLLGSTPLTPTEPLRVRLFGGFEALIGEPGIPLAELQRRPRFQMLLALLALDGPVRRERIMAELWPDLSERDAANNLRVTIAKVLDIIEPNRRRGTSFCIRANDAGLELAGPPVLHVDIVEFLAAKREARIADARYDNETARRRYGDMVALYRGDFLVGVPHVDWVLRARDEFRSAASHAATRAAELLLASHDVAEALTFGQRSIELDETREAAHRVVIAAHLLRGDELAARDAFDRLVKVLDELGTEPDRATRALARRLEAA